jgi:hypothetical protein
MPVLRRESRDEGDQMTNETASANGGRAAGAILALCVAASAVLVVFHPQETARDFAGMLKEMTAQRFMDAVVHGGFMAVAGVTTLCLAAFAARLGLNRGRVAAGLVAQTIGFIFLAGSLMTDGLILPAVAERFANADPTTLPVAKGIFVLGFGAISLLMPAGLAFQSVAALLWGSALLRDAVTRTAGIVGLLIGAAAFVLALLVAARMFDDPHVMIGIIGLLLLWDVVVALVLIRRAV